MEDELKKVLKELLKIDSYYYDSIFEYLKDVNESTKKYLRKRIRRNNGSKTLEHRSKCRKI